jgi:hypothetical protein
MTITFVIQHWWLILPHRPDFDFTKLHDMCSFLLKVQMDPIWCLLTMDMAFVFYSSGISRTDHCVFSVGIGLYLTNDRIVNWSVSFGILSLLMFNCWCSILKSFKEPISHLNGGRFFQLIWFGNLPSVHSDCGWSLDI